MDLVLLAVDTSDEFVILGTPATRIRSQTDGSHWSAPNHVFGEATAVGMSAASSYQDNSYKTDFGFFGGNQDFGRQNILMSRPHLDSTPISMNMANITTSQLESTPTEKKRQNPRH